MALRGGRLMNTHFSGGASLRTTSMVDIGHRGTGKALASSAVCLTMAHRPEPSGLEGWAEA